MSHPRFDADHFTYRVIRQAMVEAQPAHWRRRAAAFRHVLAAPDIDDARRASCEMIVANLEHRATICDLTPEEEALILDEIDRSAAVSRYLRRLDDVTGLEDLRTLWRAAAAEGRLDPGHPTYDALARAFDALARQLTARTAA